MEFTQEMAKENGLQVDLEGFKKAFDQHQEKSKAGAEQRFKGGLADTSEQTARLHSATHLLQAALRRVLQDDTISQRGSNITAERLRFDFSFGRKVTPEELKAVEDEVNRYIQAAVPITCQEMTVEEAKAQGAIGLFGDTPCGKHRGPAPLQDQEGGGQQRRRAADQGHPGLTRPHLRAGFPGPSIFSQARAALRPRPLGSLAHPHERSCHGTGAFHI